MVLNLAENCCILSATLSTFRDEGGKLKSDLNAAASGGKSRAPGRRSGSLMVLLYPYLTLWEI